MKNCTIVNKHPWIIFDMVQSSSNKYRDMLRHTYATILFDAGVDVKSAQKFLGHSDIEVTLEIYTHLSKFKEEQAIRALDEHLRERKKEPEIRLLRAL